MISRSEVIKEMRTLEEHAPQVLDLAINTLYMRGPLIDDDAETPAEYIQGFAPWASTPQGYAFWREVSDRL